MSDLFKDKYRIASARLKDWDYSHEGFYYLTICTKNREHFFGFIRNDQMILSEIGKIAQQELLKTEQLRNNIKLDMHVVMPNHIHGIVIIQHHANNPVETRRGASLQSETQSISSYKPNQFGPLPKNSLSSIINHFKGAVKKYAGDNNIAFAWQARFHDRLIRNPNELDRIRWYIENNPKLWNRDRNRN